MFTDTAHTILKSLWCFGDVLCYWVAHEKTKNFKIIFKTSIFKILYEYFGDFLINANDTSTAIHETTIYNTLRQKITGTTTTNSSTLKKEEKEMEKKLWRVINKQTTNDNINQASSTNAYATHPLGTVAPVKPL